MKSSQRTFILIAVTLCLCGIDLLTGGVGLSGMDAGIFLKLRLPRMLTALLSGACLSLAGLQMQSVFRNPLADPHIMGVSAGAGTGAAAATLLIGASLPAALSGLTVAAAAVEDLQALGGGGIFEYLCRSWSPPWRGISGTPPRC